MFGSRAILALSAAAPRRCSSSFIDAAKKGGANALLGSLVASGRFDACLQSLVIDEASDGIVKGRATVGKELQNAYSTLHGGATSTLVDVVGTMALCVLCPEP